MVRVGEGRKEIERKIADVKRDLEGLDQELSWYIDRKAKPSEKQREAYGEKMLEYQSKDNLKKAELKDPAVNELYQTVRRKLNHVLRLAEEH